jgi:hypothetical protein
MKQIILGLLFVIVMMGEGQAQERSVIANAQDLVGTFTNSELQQLEIAIADVKSKKDWDIKIVTRTSSFPKSFFNPPLAAAGNNIKSILILLPQKYVQDKEPEILVSNNLLSEILPDDIEEIKEEIIKPMLINSDEFGAALAAIKAFASIKIDFFKSEKNVAGLDDNKIKYYFSYDAIDFEGSKKPIMWKAIKANEPDFIGFKVQKYPLKNVILKNIEQNSIINLNSKKSDLQLFSGTGNTNQEPNEFVTYRANLLSAQGVTAAELRVVSYEKIELKLGIVIVDELNDDIQNIPIGNPTSSETTICVSPGLNGRLETKAFSGSTNKVVKINGLDYIVAGEDKKSESEVKDLVADSPYFDEAKITTFLNERYNPFNISWTVKIIPEHIKVDYDKNDNFIYTCCLFSNETESIQAAIKANKIGVFDRIAVLQPMKIFNPSIGYAEGMTTIGDKYCYVSLGNYHIDNAFLPKSSIVMQTIAHELGHTLGTGDLNFYQNFIPSYTDEDDPENVLTYSKLRKKKDEEKCCKEFRKFQWERIRGSASRLK